MYEPVTIDYIAAVVAIVAFIIMTLWAVFSQGDKK